MVVPIKAGELRRQIEDIENANKPVRRVRQNRPHSQKPSMLSRSTPARVPSLNKKVVNGLSLCVEPSIEPPSPSSGTLSPGKTDTPLMESPRFQTSAKKKAQGWAQPEVVMRIDHLQKDADRLRAELADAQKEMERRQESYMRREAQTQKILYGLQQEIKKAKGEDSKENTNLQEKSGTFGDQHEFIADAHNQILEGIQNLLDKQRIQMKREEAGILRNFKDRLTMLEDDLLAERSAGANTGESKWLDKAMELRGELEQMKDMATQLDGKLKESDKKCEIYRIQYETQVEKEDQLLKQTVIVKKENQELKKEMCNLHMELDKLLEEKEARGEETAGNSCQHPQKITPGRSVANPQEVIAALRKQLDGERRLAAQARAAHTTELKRRTQLQNCLAQCIEDVRGKREKLGTKLLPHPHFRLLTSLIIEQLVAKESVLKLLFSLAFPSSDTEPPPPEDSSKLRPVTQDSHAKLWKNHGNAIAIKFLSGK
ncbi:hypothetical protein BSKO_03214 [Bryopsis sp. KO-2023]|nr:hypothetical protein BSKO_03214 [Bryopsis sp. KO-2023]